MNKKQTSKLHNGLYIIYWKDNLGGGASLAAIGRLHDGSCWFAATNWVSKDPKGIACTKWRMVKSVDLVRDWN